MRQLKYLALCIALLGEQHSSTMEAGEWAEARVSEHVYRVPVNCWGETFGLAAHFPVAMGITRDQNCDLVLDFDGVLASIASAQAANREHEDAFAPEALAELEKDHGFGIVVMTGTCSTVGTITVSRDMRQLGINFTPIFLGDPTDHAALNAKLTAAWAMGVKIDCDPSNGVIFVSCPNMTPVESRRLLGLTGDQAYALWEAEDEMFRAVADRAGYARLFCDKGPALAASIGIGLLERPDLVVFVDDREDYLESMGLSCEHLGITCLLLHYVSPAV